jgi:uncharacterized membrane protein YoaK (UPF0700 family)
MTAGDGPAQDLPSVAELAARSIWHPLSRALLVLTFTTGLIDAACYLGLGQVFTANMTGNILLLGFGIAGGAHLPLLPHLISLGAFILGAAAGGLLASKLIRRHALHFGGALAIEGSLVGAAAVLCAAIDVRPDAASADAVIALLALAMGVRNVTVGRIGVPDLATTVITRALAGLVGNAPPFGGSGEGSSRRTATVLTMFAGAIVGALLLKSSLTLPVALAAALALLTSLVYVPGAAARDRARQAG